MNFKLILFIIIFAFNSGSCCHSQTKYYVIEENQAKTLFTDLLNDSIIHNAMLYYNNVDTLFLFDTEEQAINYAELILFELFGKDNIIEERPYGICRYNNFWIIGGTLQPNRKGSCFWIIFNAKDGQVILLNHDK